MQLHSNLLMSATPVMSDEPEKIDVSRVRLVRLDGVPGTVNALSMAAADAAVQSWSDDLPQGVRVRCDFEITFQDGQIYQGMYPLHAYGRKTQAFSAHVRLYLERLSKGEKIDSLGSPNGARTEIGGSGVADEAKNLLANYCF